MTSDSAYRGGSGAAAPLVIPAIGAWRELSPTHFVAAIGIGIVELVFLALTYAVIPVHVVVDCLTVFAAMAACVALHRAGHRRAAWAVLAGAYVLLAMAARRESPDRELIIGQIMGHSLVLAVFVADRAVSARASGRLAYLVAALAGIGAGALIWAVVLALAPDAMSDEIWEVEAASPYFVVLHPVYVAMEWLLFAGPAVLFHGERKLAARALQRLREAELERVRRSRELIESRLQATQARVEPQFLFNTLARVRRSHRDDPAFAERVLDELVSFLRAAMPGVGDTSSGLAREAELARAYLGILRMLLGNRLEFEIELTPDAARARLPSMLLLPLIDHLVTQGLHGGPGEARLRITAEVENGRLAIHVVDVLASAIGNGDAGGLAVLRERLAALYGERASMTFAATADGAMEALLDVPYEPAT